MYRCQPGSKMKTDLERQMWQKGGEASNSAWILVGKLQFLVCCGCCKIMENQIYRGRCGGGSCGLGKGKFPGAGGILEHKGTLRWAAPGAGTNPSPSASSALKINLHSFSPFFFFFPFSALPSRAGYF